MNPFQPAPRRQVYDCFCFFNELDILEIRLGELECVVDYFVIVESPTTFSGKAKPLHFAENSSRFARFKSKIIHVVVNDSPVSAASAWTREAFQRNAIMRGLAGAKNDDLVIISDVDEIPKAEALSRALRRRFLLHRVIGFWTQTFQYRLNLLDSSVDHRLCPMLIARKNLREPELFRKFQVRTSRRRWVRPLNALIALPRTMKVLGRLLWPTVVWEGAWHFSSIGDADALEAKYSSYSHTEKVRTDGYESVIINALASVDAPGSPFRRMHHALLPKFISENQDRLTHLLLPP